MWHELGGRGSATMMFGHVETLAERIEHLERLRRLQDETHGFTAFICWTFQPGNTDAGRPAQGRGVRVSEDAGRQPAVSRQLRQPPGELGHAGADGRPVGPAVRGQRLGQPDDRGERGGGGRHGSLPDADEIRGAIARAGLRPSPEERVLRTDRRNAAAAAGCGVKYRPPLIRWMKGSVAMGRCVSGSRVHVG